MQLTEDQIRGVSACLLCSWLSDLEEASRKGALGWLRWEARPGPSACQVREASWHVESGALWTFSKYLPAGQAKITRTSAGAQPWGEVSELHLEQS